MNILSNNVNLVGRVNYIDTKYYGDMAITRILLSKKTGENNYESFGISFFKDVADKLSQQIKKGDYLAIEGFLKENKYTKDTKEYSRLEINGRDFCKVKYDEKEKKYVEDKDVLPTIDEAFPEESIPWD